MRRQGWAFCLGLLVSGTGLAQPPASSERYPPAPDLPGVAVGQSSAGKPVGKVIPIDGQTLNPILAEPSPLPKSTEKPTEGDTLPLPTPALPVPTTVPPIPSAACETDKKCLSLDCGKHLGMMSRVKEWLCFRSTSRQNGHYITPYRPPLQAWFPCEPGSKSCPTCRDGGIPAPAQGGELFMSEPTVVPPPAEKPIPEAPPVAPRPLPEGKDPGPVPPAPPKMDVELPPGFGKVEGGIGFAPGAAPMARPTTQTKTVSSWRPK